MLRVWVSQDTSGMNCIQWIQSQHLSKCSLATCASIYSICISDPSWLAQQRTIHADVFWIVPWMHCVHGQTINLLNSCLSLDSYIKPQPTVNVQVDQLRCLSLDSYIKPQQPLYTNKPICVVYLLIPTSNHNLTETEEFALQVVYLLIPTSNHNFSPRQTRPSCVVYLLIPTSNHNLEAYCLEPKNVVYLLIPTSNHNRQRY